MKPDRSSGEQWSRVCGLASRLLDSPAAEWNAILEQECGADVELRAQVEAACREYSEDDDLFGVPVASPLAMEDSLAGQRIGPWEIRRLLGEGGMGRVYLVERADGVFAQQAALKLARESTDPGAVRRFLAERRIVAMLDHPAIARAIDGGTTPAGAPYLVMEYVEGACPIDEFQPSSPVRDKIRLFLQVVEAVEAAHRQQVAHRDLKPSNILVTPDGRPKILDFGIAKLIEAERPSGDRTNTTRMAATPAYASPEQLAGEPSTLSSDIYSLGAVLYKMLTGRPPHEVGELNLLQSIRMVTETDSEVPSRYALQVDADVDAMVSKALARRPAQRYSSAAELAADLRRYLEGKPVLAREGAFWYRAHRFGRRHRGVVVALAAALVLLAAGATKLFLDWRSERQRLNDLRINAGAIMAEYQSQLSRLSGSTALRHQIAADQRSYLNSISADAAQDEGLRRQVAVAYGSLANHLSGKLEAQQSLGKAAALWRGLGQDRLTEADRLEMAGVLRRLGWSHIGVGKLTDAAPPLDESLRLLDGLAGTASETAARRERAMVYFEMSRLGAWAGNGSRAIEYARKAVQEQEKLPPQPLDRKGIALTRMQLADAADTYGSSDPNLLREALEQTRKAVREVREASACVETSCLETKAAVLTRAPVIFIHQGLYQEALAQREGVDLAEELLAEDPGNQSALTSLRMGLHYLGWLLQDTVGDLEASLRVRRRLLEVSVVSGRNPGAPEDRLKEAIACGELGRVLVAMKRLREALGYFERQAEILSHPPTENVYWFMRQTDVYVDLGKLLERLGRPEAARAEFAKASAAAATFLAKTGSSRAKAIEAEVNYWQGKALMAVDKPAGCGLLRRSLDRYAELTKAAGKVSQEWEAGVGQARQAASDCGL